MLFKFIWPKQIFPSQMVGLKPCCENQFRLLEIDFEPFQVSCVDSLFRKEKKAGKSNIPSWRMLFFINTPNALFFFDNVNIMIRCDFEQ